MGWVVIQDDTFTRANTSPDSTPNSMDGVGNGWIDAHGGIGNISANRLELNSDSTDDNSWSRDFILRPPSENKQDQKIISVLRATDMAVGANYLHIHRWNPRSGSPTFYLFFFNYVSTTTAHRSAYAVNGSVGSAVQIGTDHSDGLIAGHDYQITTTVTEINPTTVAMGVFDLTANADLGTVTFSTSESTASLQTSGQSGVCSNNRTGPIQYYDEISTYFFSDATMSTSPSTIYRSSTGNSVTVTGVGTNFSGSPFTISDGTIAAQVINTATSATLTITAPGTAETVTITDVGSGATCSLTIANPTISVSPPTLVESTTGNTLTITGVGTSWTAGTPGSPSFTVSGGTITAQHVASATSATLTYTAPGSTGSVTITDPSTGATATLTIAATSASDFSVDPGTHTTTPGVATGVYQVSLNGALSANVSIALSDGGAGGAFSPAGPLVFTPGNAGTPQNVAYTPPGGSGGGTIALGFSATGAFTASHSANCVVSSGPVGVTVTDPNVFFSPYNWRLSGSDFAVSACNGAYIKMGFSGTSIGVSLNISGYAALYGNTALWPKVRWSIDGRATVDHQLTPGDGTLTLGSDLAAGAHTLFFCMVSTTDGYDRWVGPASAVVVTGFLLDEGAETIAPALAATRVLFFGDSITEGVKTTGLIGSGDIANNDSQLEWCAMLGKAFPAEYGQVGYGGLGWVLPSAGSSPPGAVPFFTPGNDTLSSWNKYSQGRSRLVSGLFSPAPDIVCIMLGANDRTQPGDAVQASATAALPAIRAATPDAWIFVIYEVTPSNQKAAILAAFDAYQAAAPDLKCAIVDCGLEAHFNFNSVTTPTDMAGDGIHPNYYATGQIAGIVMRQIQDAMQGGGTQATAGYSRARVANE